MQVKSLFAYLEVNVAIHDVKPLLLIQMQVESRPAGEQIGVLDDEEEAGVSLAGTLKRIELKPSEWGCPK